VKHKVFRSLRRATRALPLTYKPLKRLDLNFKYLGEVDKLLTF
jgi:hypothetical protein